LERAAGGLGGLDAREAVRVRRAAAGAADDVELVIVEAERERLDADGFAGSVEAAIADLQGAAPLERVDHFLEEVLVLRQRLLAAADEEHELAARVLEALRVERVAADVVDEVVHPRLVAGALEELRQARADA